MFPARLVPDTVSGTNMRLVPDTVSGTNMSLKIMSVYILILYLHTIL